jgi:hypothetical protein
LILIWIFFLATFWSRDPIFSILAPFAPMITPGLAVLMTIVILWDAG